MKALVYQGPGQKAWESAPDPSILEPTDAIVRIDTSTICGTDLHILKGDVPAVKPGTILGHEAVATATSALPTLRPGRATALAAVLAALAALAVLSWHRLGRRPALRPIPVPVRTARGRGPPSSSST